MLEILVKGLFTSTINECFIDIQHKMLFFFPLQKSDLKPVIFVNIVFHAVPGEPLTSHSGFYLASHAAPPLPSPPLPLCA